MEWPYSEMDALCADVRLHRRDGQLDEIASEVGTPKDAALWEGTYAAVLLWPCVEERLADAAVDGQSWLDELLMLRETRDRPIDGYLVLALPVPPAEAATTALVATIELSTQVCRKQVVWPRAKSEMGWRGLAGVSVLGFPEGAGRGEVLTWPDMDPEATALYARIAEVGHAQAAEDDRGEG